MAERGSQLNQKALTPEMKTAQLALMAAARSAESTTRANVHIVAVAVSIVIIALI
jgi:hypothetical protein